MISCDPLQSIPHADVILPPLSGFAVVFAEDVVDVPEEDFVTGAFANLRHLNEHLKHIF